MDGLVHFCGVIGCQLQPPCSLCLGYRFGAFSVHSAHWAFSLQAQFLRLQITSLNLDRSHGIRLPQAALACERWLLCSSLMAALFNHTTLDQVVSLQNYSLECKMRRVQPEGEDQQSRTWMADFF